MKGTPRRDIRFCYFPRVLGFEHLQFCLFQFQKLCYDNSEFESSWGRKITTVVSGYLGRHLINWENDIKGILKFYQIEEEKL